MRHLKQLAQLKASIIGMVLILIVSSQNLFASNLGGYAGSSTRFTADPLSAGTGGITLFQSSSTNSFSQNPTAQAWLGKRSFDAGMVQLSLDRFIYSVSAGIPMPPTAQLSLGVIAAGTNHIEARDSRGYYAGELSDTEMTYLVSFSNRFSEKLAFGVSLKILNKQFSAEDDWLDLKGTGFGAGIGVTYKPRQGSTIAFALKDWNSSYKWKTQDLFTYGSSYRDIIPMSFAWGLHQAVGPVSIALEHDYYLFGESIFRGAFMWNGFKSLTLNAGLSYEDDIILPGLSARYEVSWKQGPPMHIDLGIRTGIPGEGFRNYLGWGVNF